MKKTLYLLLLLCVMVAQSCYKDVDETTIIDTRIPGAEIIQQYNGSVTVYVTDINGNSIQGADVFIFDSKTVSDAYGIAEFINIPLDKTGTFISAIKEDFLYGAEKFNPTEINNHVVLRMLPIQGLKTFDTNENVSIEVTNGGKIDIKPNSLIDLQGNIYSGTATILAQRIGTEDPYFSELIPGDHTGVNQQGSAKILEIFSAIVVRIFDAAGNELTFLEGKEGKVSFVMPPELSNNAPDDILLWRFNNTTGLWIEDGTATISNGTFEGFISKPDTWICAKPYNYINVKGIVTDQNGRGIPSADISVLADSKVSDAVTDASGNFYIKVPASANLKLQVLKNGCDEIFSENDISTGLNDLNLDPIVIDLSDTKLFEGKVSCMASPVADAYVYIISEYGTYKIKTDEQGSFSRILLEGKCDPEQSISILGLDPTNQNESPIYDVIFNDQTIHEIDVCINCMFEVEIVGEYIDLCNLEAELTANIDGGSGSYSYSWNQGGMQNSITVYTAETFCVTVTDDLTECEVEKCLIVTITSELEVNAFSESISCEQNGFAMLEATGGTESYMFEWSGPGGFTSNASLLDNILDAGLYSYIVTDTNGCTVAGEVLINDETAIFALEVYANSSYNVICDNQEEFLTVECDGCDLDLNNAIWTLPDGSEEFGPTMFANQEGLYFVNVESLNCSSTGSIQLQEVSFDTPNFSFICDGQGGMEVLVDNLQVGFSQDFITYSYYDLVENFQLNNDIFVNIYSPYPSCSLAYDVTLPTYLGLSVLDKIIPSCGDCPEGQIIIENDELNCYECTFEQQFIYLEGDYQNDLSTANSESLLLKGNYYIVTKSIDGCVLNSTFVVL